MTQSEQTDIAIIYLHKLTGGATLLGMQVRLSTLKGYMNAMAKWVETHVGRDIQYHPTQELLNVPMEQWEHDSMFDNIYTDTKRGREWQIDKILLLRVWLTIYEPSLWGKILITTPVPSSILQFWRPKLDGRG